MIDVLLWVLHGALALIAVVVLLIFVIGFIFVSMVIRSFIAEYKRLGTEEKYKRLKEYRSGKMPPRAHRSTYEDTVEIDATYPEIGN